QPDSTLVSIMPRVSPALSACRRLTTPAWLRASAANLGGISLLTRPILGQPPDSSRPSHVQLGPFVRFIPIKAACRRWHAVHPARANHDRGNSAAYLLYFREKEIWRGGVRPRTAGSLDRRGARGLGVWRSG